MDQFKKFLRLAFSGPVVRRALFYAVVVGTILIAINHGPNIVCGTYKTTCIIQMLMTMCVPYVVSTLSSVQAMMQRCDAVEKAQKARPVQTSSTR